MIRVIREINHETNRQKHEYTYKLNGSSEVLWSDDGNGDNLYKVVVTCSEQLQVPLLYIDLSLVIDSAA